jgi:hypothetical protein
MTSPAPQLGLSFDAHVLQTWTDAAAAQVGLELSVALTRTGARLTLIGPWPGGDGEAPPPRGILWRAVVDVVGTTVGASISPAPEGAERLARATAFASDLPIDCFTAPLAWTARVALEHDLPAEDLLLAMRRSLVLVARHLTRLLVEPALAACRPFPLAGGMRWFVYEAAANDPSGRVSRLASCCPGLLVLCKALCDRGAVAACREILTATAQGASPGRLLALALRAWAERRGASASPDEVTRQRVRISRAGPQASPEMLWQGTAPAIPRGGDTLRPAAC